MKKTINVAVIGKGAMGRTHSASIAMLKYSFKNMPFEVKLHTLVLRSEENMREEADALGFENVTTRYEDVLENPEIDVIDICTPNNLHFDMVEKAVKAGKHILCEKPLGINAEETEKMLKMIKDSDKCYGMVFNNRHLPCIMRAKQIVEEGKLGRILSFRCAYRHSSGTDPEKNAGWKQNKDICGGGVLFDLGSHVIDLVHYLCGDIESVSAKSQIAYPQRTGMNGETWQTNADEAFYMLCELKCGGIGTITASKVHTGANDDVVLEIYGEKGALKYSLMECEWLHFYDNEAKSSPLGGEKGYTKIECVGRYDAPGGVFPSPKAPVGWLMGHVTNYMEFLSSVCECKTPCPTLSDGVYVQRVMEAGYKSDALHRWIKVDDLSEL